MKRDPFEDVLEAFAVDLGHDVGTVLDPDEIYHQALEEGVVTEAWLDASFEKLLAMPLLEVDAERLALDPIGALAAACAAAGATMSIWGRPVTEAELRLDAADDDPRRIYDMVTVPGFIVVPADPKPRLDEESLRLMRDGILARPIRATLATDIDVEVVVTDQAMLEAIRENTPVTFVESTAEVDDGSHGCIGDPCELCAELRARR